MRAMATNKILTKLFKRAKRETGNAKPDHVQHDSQYVFHLHLNCYFCNQSTTTGSELTCMYARVPTFLENSWKSDPPGENPELLRLLNNSRNLCLFLFYFFMTTATFFCSISPPLKSSATLFLILLLVMSLKPHKVSPVSTSLLVSHTQISSLAQYK